MRVNAAARVPEVLKVGEEPSALEERLRAIIASSKDEELKVRTFRLSASYLPERSSFFVPSGRTPSTTSGPQLGNVPRCAILSGMSVRFVFAIDLERQRSNI